MKRAAAQEFIVTGETSLVINIALPLTAHVLVEPLTEGKLAQKEAYTEEGLTGVNGTSSSWFVLQRCTASKSTL